MESLKFRCRVRTIVITLLFPLIAMLCGNAWAELSLPAIQVVPNFTAVDAKAFCAEELEHIISLGLANEIPYKEYIVEHNWEVVQDCTLTSYTGPYSNGQPYLAYQLLVLNYIKYDNVDPNEMYFPYGTGSFLFVFPPDSLDRGKSVTQTCEPSCLGNPIRFSEGNKVESLTDFVAGHDNRFQWVRYYNSSALMEGARLGRKWRHSFSRSIAFKDLPDETALLYRDDGQIIAFKQQGGAWISESDVTLRLTPRDDAPGWLVNDDLSETVERYDADGDLEKIDYNDGYFIELYYAYQPEKQLVMLSDRSGRSMSIIYNDLALISDVLLPDGHEIGYGYQGLDDYPLLHDHVLTEITQSDGTSKQYQYAPSKIAILEAIIDEQSKEYARFTYNNFFDRAVGTSHAGGANIYIGEISNAVTPLTATVTDPNGLSTKYDFSLFNGVNRTTKVTRDCPGACTEFQTFTYDANGRPDLQSDFAGRVTDLDYDAKGQLTRTVEAVGTTSERRIETDWSPSFSVPSERRTYKPDGTLLARQSWGINARGQIQSASSIDPASSTTRTTTTTYCEQSDVDNANCPIVGLVKSVDGPRTDATDVATYTYYQTDDASCATAPTTCPHRKGDLWKVTNALGQVAEILKYYGDGRVLSVKDINGVTTDLEYHPRGWLTARKVRGINNASENDDQITQIEYWPTGLVKKVTQPDGSYTSYIYDDAHRLTDITDNLGNTIHYTLDGAGNRTAEATKDPSGTLTRTLSRIYNSLGQLTTQFDAQLHPTGFTYDDNGNPDTVTDALNHVTDNDHDPLNRLRSTIQDLNGIAAQTQFGYDALDNLTQVTDPKGLNTTYTYNGLSDLKSMSSPDTGTTNYTYDSGGNRQTQTDQKGVTATYSYDALNRLTGIAYPTTSLNVGYVYDTPGVVCATGETFGKGRLAKITDATGSTSYCYGRFGDLLRKVQVTNGKVFTVRYGYDRAGRMTSLTYPDGTVADYVRDGLGNITETGLTRPSQPRVVVVTGATYAPFGPSTGWAYPGGRSLARPLDQDYRPAKVFDGSSGGGLSLSFGFDPVGNLDTLQDGLQSQTLARYHYDGLNRLDQTQDGPTGTPIETYGYDATGNRSSVTINVGGTTNYLYPAGNHRLFSVGGVVRLYDANGNTTSIGGTAKVFRFNDANRMDQAKASGTVLMNYAYNGKGEQVRRYLGATSTYTVYDEAGHWLGDYDGTGAPLQQAVWMDDLPVGLSADKLYYVEPDHLGTPRAVIDPTRNLAVWRWDLNGEAFGATAPNQDPDGDSTAFVFNLRYPGQRYDAASGLNQNGFRDQETATGRYLQPDPLGLRAGPSIYAYANSEPTVSIDPFGLQIRVPSAHTWRPNAGNYNNRSPVPYTPPGVNVPLTIPVHDPTSSYWESAAMKLSPWDYTMLCVDVWCMQRRTENQCSMYDRWERENQTGGYPTVLSVTQRGCECRKAIFRDQVPSSGPDQADALDAAELAARLIQLRMGR